MSDTAAPGGVDKTSTPVNQIGPGRARAGEAPIRSMAKGDVPPLLLDRYLIERDRKGRPERFYRDHRTPDPAFRDAGRRLSADRPYPDTVADMLKIAQHRGWTRLKVEGEEAFRREVWVQGRAMGLEVGGYRPRDRDRGAAGLADARTEREDRLRRVSAVVRSLILDPDSQRRLLAHAITRSGLLKDTDGYSRPERSRDRTR